MPPSRVRLHISAKRLMSSAIATHRGDSLQDRQGEDGERARQKRKRKRLETYRETDRERKRFSARSFFAPSWGHGRPHVPVMDVRTQMLVFSKVSRACPKFLARDVRANEPGMSAGYPARKLSLWALFFVPEQSERARDGVDGSHSNTFFLFI